MDKSKNCSAPLGVRIRSRLYSLSTLCILLVVFIFFTVLNSFRGYNFQSLSNISVIVNQASFLALLGVSQFLVILVGDINLSIGSIMVFCSIIASPLLMESNNYFFMLAIIAMVAIGAAVGLVNGLLVTKLKIPSFIATFGVSIIFRGLAWIIMGKNVLYRINPDLRFLAQGTLISLGKFNFTMPMLICILIIALFAFILKRTTFGHKIYFTGSNPVAARFSGIPVNRVITTVHVLSGALAGFCGVMFAARINACEPGMYANSHFDAVSVALISGASMSGGFGNVWGCVSGALIISVIQSGMNSVKIPSELQTLVLGVLIILSVSFNQFLMKRRAVVSMELSDKQSVQDTGNPTKFSSAKG